MEQRTLSAEARSNLKKGASRRLRKSGRIPAVIYGHSGTSTISIDAREFGRKFKRISENTIINLQVDKSAYDVLVKDYQEDILKGDITHIDFYEIERGKALRTNVPLHGIGTPVGVREGGLLEELLHVLEVECLPKDIPESIEVNIEEMVVGSSIHLSDIPVPENVKFLAPENTVLFTVTAPKAIIEEEEEELEEGLLEGEEGEEVGEEGEEAAPEEAAAEEE